MKKIFNLLLSTFFVIVFLFFSNNYLVSFADELIFDSEAFERDIDVIQHGYIEQHVLDYYNENVSSDEENAVGVECSEKLLPGLDIPFVASTATLTLDVSNVDAVLIEVSPIMWQDNSYYGSGYYGKSEASELAPYLFKSDATVTTLTLDLDYVDGDDYAIGYAIYRIVTYTRAQDTQEDFENSFFFTNLDVASMRPYSGLVAFDCLTPTDTALETGAKAYGYVQGVHHGALDFALNSTDNINSTLPACSSEWSDGDLSRFETGFGDGYNSTQETLSSADNPFANYNKPNAGSDNGLRVNIYNYDNVQIATLTVQLGDVVTLEDIKTACGGTLLDERWLSVTGDVATKYDFSQPITSSIDLIPQGCEVVIYDLDLKTVLGALTVEYGATVTVEDIKTACGGTLPADEFNHFTSYEDVNGATVTEIIGKFDFTQPLKVDYNLIKLQYEVEIWDNETGAVLSAFYVDSGSILTKDSIYEALSSAGYSNYKINNAQYWGEDDFELEKTEVRANVMVTVIKEAEGGKPSEDADNKEEHPDGETSVGKGTNTGLGFGLELDMAKVFSLIFILILFFLIYFFVSFINKLFKKRRQ